MKKIIAVFCFIAGMQTVFAQKLNVDSSIRVIAVEKDDDKKVELLAGLHTNEFNNSPNLVIEIGLKLLKQSQVDKSIIEASAAYSMLGHGYRLMGNNIKGLEYHHKAISLAEKTGTFHCWQWLKINWRIFTKTAVKTKKPLNYTCLLQTMPKKGKTK